jgi:hypothetical protein
MSTRVASQVALPALLGFLLASCGSRDAAPRAVEERSGSQVEALAVQSGELPTGSVASETRDPQGRLTARGWLCDDRPVGPWIYYYANGRPALRGRYVYGGKPSGPWMAWYEDGTPMSQGEYRRGQRDGVWTFYYPNGRATAKGRYREGQRDGRWMVWHANGQRAAMGSFQEDQPIALWRGWREDGEPLAAVSHRQVDSSFPQLPAHLQPPAR